MNLLCAWQVLKNTNLLRRKLANTRLGVNLGPTTCQRTCYEPVTSKFWTCIEKGSQCNTWKSRNVSGFLLQALPSISLAITCKKALMSQKPQNVAAFNKSQVMCTPPLAQLELYVSYTWVKNMSYTLVDKIMFWVYVTPLCQPTPRTLFPKRSPTLMCPFSRCPWVSDTDLRSCRIWVFGQLLPGAFYKWRLV